MLLVDVPSQSMWIALLHHSTYLLIPTKMKVVAECCHYVAKVGTYPPDWNKWQNHSPAILNFRGKGVSECPCGLHASTSLYVLHGSKHIVLTMAIIPVGYGHGPRALPVSGFWWTQSMHWLNILRPFHPACPHTATQNCTILRETALPHQQCPQWWRATESSGRDQLVVDSVHTHGHSHLMWAFLHCMAIFDLAWP